MNAGCARMVGAQKSPETAWRRANLLFTEQPCLRKVKYRHAQLADALQAAGSAMETRLKKDQFSGHRLIAPPVRQHLRR